MFKAVKAFNVVKAVNIFTILTIFDGLDDLEHVRGP